ncbi:MAG TPA: aromatic amino acid ammonia-lyase [bacterium]|mgnify:CR=1 FL=1|nr:aromatic amino acid ammonia-lyase [bacterium]HPN45960.1 aromatic amino acid ammonia-lyase [bacterium]
MSHTITIDHTRKLTLEQIAAAGAGNARFALAEATRTMLAERRRQVVEYLAGQKYPAYGFNRGFGHNVDLAVDEAHLAALQENLITSHAVGVGEPAPDAIVRVTMLLRAQSLAQGYSGVRPCVVEQLLNMLNNDILPVVPELGSVGASGDLAPLSHIALGMLGMGKVRVNGETVNAADALRAAGLQPLKLEMKEGLALNNGVQYMTAIGLHCCRQMQILLKTAAIETAMTAQVMLAPETPFRHDLHLLRPHPGALKVAGWIYALMQDSPLREAHRDYRIDGEIQDPYNIRCAAQILGSCAELIDECEKALLLEANSVTDNPVLLPLVEENTHRPAGQYAGQFVDIVSGGQFHGMPVAVRVYNLFQAMGIMAGLVNRRCARYVDANQNKGLGRDLKWPDLSNAERAVSSGMMLLEYTSAALTNAIWGEAMPSHLFNISTNTGQEDHVSMGTSLAVRVMHSLPKLANLLAIEMAYISQAAAIRKRLPYIPSVAPIFDEIKQKLGTIQKDLQSQENPFTLEIQVREHYPITPEQRKLNPVCENILARVAEIFPPVTHDRVMADELAELARFVAEGKVVEMVGV